MNRLGIMIDVSHVSDDAFEQVLEISRAPVIASHSSCRHFTPGWERNLSDDMIRRLADKNGVVQISFGAVFLRDEIRQRSRKNSDAVKEYAKANGLVRDSEEYRDYKKTYFEQHPIGEASVKDVADHIDHICQLAGNSQYAAIGSDVGGRYHMPSDFATIADLQKLEPILAKRGYSETDLENIFNANWLRHFRRWLPNS